MYGCMCGGIMCVALWCVYAYKCTYTHVHEYCRMLVDMSNLYLCPVLGTGIESFELFVHLFTCIFVRFMLHATHLALAH